MEWISYHYKSPYNLFAITGSKDNRIRWDFSFEGKPRMTILSFLFFQAPMKTRIAAERRLMIIYYAFLLWIFDNDWFPSTSEKEGMTSRTELEEQVQKNHTL